MSRSDLTPSQNARLRAAIKDWLDADARRKIGEFVRRANGPRGKGVWQPTISNLLNNKGGVSYQTAEKIARNAFGKTVQEIIGEPDEPFTSATSEYDLAVQMARAGNFPIESIEEVAAAHKPDEPRTKYEWFELFKVAALAYERALAAMSPLGKKKAKKRINPSLDDGVVVSSPASARPRKVRTGT